MDEALPNVGLENSKVIDNKIFNIVRSEDVGIWLAKILVAIIENRVNLGVDFQFIVADPRKVNEDHQYAFQVIDTTGYSIREDLIRISKELA